MEGTESGTICKAENTLLNLAITPMSAQKTAMFSTVELLALLDEAGVKQKDVAAVLGVAAPRISALYAGDRRLQLDEAKKLVEHFGIAEMVATPQPIPLPIQVARLLILHAASYLGLRVGPMDPRVEELARDFRAFSKFALDPLVRESSEAAGAFLQGMSLARDPTV